MANQINIPQFQGTQQVNRRIDSTAGYVVGFDSDGKLAALSLSGITGDSGPGLTSPVIMGDPSGVVIAKRISFVEDATNVTHTGTVTLPAGATLHDIQVDMGALWTATTASMKVGDTADDDGYFTGIDLKATDLLVGEQLRISSSTLWGGQEGAYLVAATGRRGPTTSNFGGKYVAGTDIIATVTVGTPATTVGRTYVTVTYSLGESVTPVLSAV